MALHETKKEKWASHRKSDLKFLKSIGWGYKYEKRQKTPDGPQWKRGPPNGERGDTSLHWGVVLSSSEDDEAFESAFLSREKGGSFSKEKERLSIM